MPATVHVLVDTPATIEARFYADGVLTNDNPVTIGITKADGTALVASGTATTNPSTGVYRYPLTSTHTAELNLLTATWTGASQLQVTKVEIVGDHLFNLVDLRALRVAGSTPFSTSASPLFSDTQIMEARAATLDEFRAILGFHPVPRFCRETKDGDGRPSVILTDPGLKASKLLSVTVDGAVRSLADYTLKPPGILLATSGYRASGNFPDGIANVTVEYVSGWSRIEGEGSHAAMTWAAKYLQPSGFSNATTVTTPDGMSYSYVPSEVGRGGYRRHTGIRDLDEWLNRHSQAGALVM